MKLSELLTSHDSDKCNHHSYGFIYDHLGFPKDADLDILESGVEKGGSLCAWKEYFPNARVTGVDIVDSRLPQFIRPDVEFVLSDIKQYKPDRRFDLIIEDGNHSNSDALWAGEYLSERLKVGGTLIIEDVQESFMVPFLLWGKLGGGFIVTAVDLRRLSHRSDHKVVADNFVVVITRVLE